MGDVHEPYGLIIPEDPRRALRPADHVELEPVVLWIAVRQNTHTVAVQIDAMVLDDAFILCIESKPCWARAREVKYKEREREWAAREGTGVS